MLEGGAAWANTSTLTTAADDDDDDDDDEEEADEFTSLEDDVDIVDKAEVV